MNLRKRLIQLCLSFMMLSFGANLTAQCIESAVTTTDGLQMVYTCTQDEGADVLTFTNSGSGDANYAYVITDEDGNILGLPQGNEQDFNDAPPGTCLVWGLSYTGEILVGQGDNALTNALTDGCYQLSDNYIEVVRRIPFAGTAVTDQGETATTLCVGDGQDDIIYFGNYGESDNPYRYLVTDDAGNFLTTDMAGFVNFEGAPAGICRVYGLSYLGDITIQAGENVYESQLASQCFDLTDNYVEITRVSTAGGTLRALTGNVYNRVVVANRASGTISVINSDNHEIEKTVEMPDDGEPMYVVYNAYSNSVLVGDYNGKVVAFDAKSFEVLGSADAGAGVFHMWLSPNNQQLWVNNELDRTISVINPNTLELIATVNLPQDLYDAGYKPHDVIVMPNNAAAFVTMLGSGDEDYVVKYDATTFEETTRAAVGLDPHVSLTAANPNLYVASQGGDELKVLLRSDLSEIASVDIPNAHGLGINNAGTYLYIGNISDGGVNATYTLDLSNNTLVGNPVDAPFAAPHNYAVTGNDEQLFLTHSGATNDKVSIYGLSPTPTLTGSITVGNNPFGLVAYSFVETFTETTICAGDGVSDGFDVSIDGAQGANSAWVITDAEGNILALPPSPPFDLEGAGAGVCLIWHLSYEDGLQGAEVGMNANDLEGCFSLSNPITVYRNSPEGGTLEGGPFEFCVGDGIADNVSGITLSGNSGANSQWVVTDDAGTILGLPPMPGVVDFDGAPAGVCLIWHLSYEDGLQGADVGMNANDLEGCFSLSNPITVYRHQTEGGTLEGGPFEFCVGDGIADNVSGITLSGNSGANAQWVVTDDAGTILGLPPMPGVVDFDGAPAGVCLIWHLSYEDGLQGAEVGMNANDLEGCFSLSNPITVYRNSPEGGTLEGGPFEFCVGDGIADNVSGITLSGNSGTNAQWVVTDDAGNILGLPPMPGVVDFDGAPAGVCLIWHLSYEDGLQGAEVGMNANDLEGCFSLSNPITVYRHQTEGGTLEGGPFEFCVGDGIADNVSGITLSGNSGTNSQWVVTDDAGNILGLPPMPGVVDFDGAPAGVCLIWHLSYEDGLQGAEVGMNANDLEGCFSLSNPITVYRHQPEGGSVATDAGETAQTIIVGDGEDDIIYFANYQESDNDYKYLVTDGEGHFLTVAQGGFVNFEGAPAGVCRVYGLSFFGEITIESGQHIAEADLASGCYDLSDNFVEITRVVWEGAVVTTPEGETAVYTCPGDGEDDIVLFVTSYDGDAAYAYVITDNNNNILAFPEGDFGNFEGAPAGICSVWGVAYEGELVGEAGMNIEDLTSSDGYLELSGNYITINRVDPFAGQVVTDSGETKATICVGDGEDDVIYFGNYGESDNPYVYLVTDGEGNFLTVAQGGFVNFEGAPAGVCRVYGLSYTGEVIIEQGQSIEGTQLASMCYDLTDHYVEINRIDCDEPTALIGGEGELGNTSVRSNNISPIDELAIEEVVLYPNPVVETLEVKLNASQVNSNTLLAVYNGSGALLLGETIHLQEGFNQIRLDVNHLTDGVYFLILKTDNSIVNKRFVKTK